MRQERWKERSPGRSLIFAMLILTVILSIPHHVQAARYSYAYPTAPDKKGVALGADMEEDALELNVHHTTLNFPITEFTAAEWEKNSRDSFSYRYKGKKYWFRKPQVRAWDRTLLEMKENNTVVTGILLMQDRPDLRNLIYPKARGKKASFYAWNMDGGRNQRKIEAAISFLANRYASGRHGRVVGWIVGNEIDTASSWNNAGGISFRKYMDLYAKMFETTSKIVRKVYSNARVYVPLDHFWNMIYSNDYKAKDCLDAFAVRMNRDGYQWNVAFHAYNGDLMQPSITAEQYFDTTSEVDTPIITMKNLNVLTYYIRTRYGADKRVILSEHGYSSTWKGQDVSKDQSTAVALSYYLAEQNPMVDSFIYYSQVDQNELTKVGASFGLWKVSPYEKATKKKPSWAVFKYMDTDHHSKILDEARNTSRKMTGSPVKSTRKLTLASQKSLKKYQLKVRLSKKWKVCGAVFSSRFSGKAYQLKHDGRRNRNVYWGLQQSFRKLDISRHPRLAFTIKGTRLSGVRGKVLVRVFCGNKATLEASGNLKPGTRRIMVDLSKWEYRKAVTRIQILVKRSSGSWHSGAAVKITDIGLL